MSGDGKLLSVVEHWLPRMEVGGIPTSTARAIIARAGDWSGWLREWTAEGDRHAAHAAEALAKGWRVTAGESLARAAQLYHFGQFMAFEDMALKEQAAARKCALYRLAAPLLDPPAEALEIPVDGGVLQAYLRLPPGDVPAPLALIIPGSDSTKEEFSALERVFLARGIATLSVDGPGQGEGRSLGPLRPDIGPELARVIQHVQPDPRLSGRIGLVGMAFGGFLALRAASTLPGLAAVVSINGFADLGAFGPTMPQVYRDNLRFAFATDAVLDYARGFTLAGLDGPTCPALILHGGQDKIFPPSEAQASADFCRGAVELQVFANGNHVCNNIAWLYRPLVADWLGDRLRSG